MMPMMKINMSMLLVLLGFAVTQIAAGPGSCVGRCGESFSRGQQCNCDFSCLQHGECCPDFQAVCTSAQSCQGRCGEAFRRGQLCECDPQCVSFNTCCPDYQRHCDASAAVSQSRNFQPLRAASSGRRKSEKNKKKSNSESEESYTAKEPCSKQPGSLGCQDAVEALNPRPSGPAPPAMPTNLLQQGVGDVPVGHLPLTQGGGPDSPAPGSSLDSLSFASGVRGADGPSGPGVVTGKLNLHLVLSPAGGAPFAPNQDSQGPTGSRPSTLQDVAQGLALSGLDPASEGPGTGGAGIFVDVNLCSESLMNGLTALINGTILIFKGELFWSVDPVTRSAGQPQSITESLGIPAPIDTVFTRCNCHAHTYIIKGDQVWRLDGDMTMEPGYPKPLSSEFPGLTGGISAALPVPATRGSPEAVHFFKKGDVMQKFTFPAGSSAPCSTKARAPDTRQAGPEALLSGEINLKVSLKGFPTPVTSALTLPSPQRANQYQHYIFSGPLFFSIKISGNLPMLAKPDPSAVFAPLPMLSPSATTTTPANTAVPSRPNPGPANSIRVWLGCP